MKIHYALFWLSSVATAFDFQCNLLRVDTQTKVIMADGQPTGMQSTESWSCEVESDLSLQYYDVPEELAQQLSGGEGAPGLLQVMGATLDRDNAQITWQQNSTLSVVNAANRSKRRRHLVQTAGTSHVLVVRVNYRGKTPTLSRNQLAGRVFGLGSTNPPNNMANQFSACSFGKFKTVPFRGTNVWNGVTEITINSAVSGSNGVVALQNKVVDAIQAKYSIGSIDHLMIVLPDAGLLKGGGSYIAYGYLNSKITVFNNLWGGRLSGLVHEVGHNLNLHHSGRGSVEYGDNSGYMGYGSLDTSGPAKCFNAQKHWTLGWFDDRSLSLDVKDLPWTGTLASFVDYNQTESSQPVVMTLGGRLGQKLYLQYNRAEDMNSGTPLFRNQVTVLTAKLEYGALKSNALGGISTTVGSRLRVGNFETTGKSLSITVCESKNLPISKVRLSIHLEDGTQQQMCDVNPIEPARCENAAASAYFYVENSGPKNCNWLADSTKRENKNRWVNKVCVHNHLANYYCRRTCDKTCDQ